MQTHSAQKPAAVTVLVLLLLFLALNALGAGAAFILAPDGHLIRMPLANLDKSPFHNFLIPGLLLFFFLGVYPTAAAYSLWRRPGWKWPNLLNPFQRTHWSWAGSLAAGAALVVWIVIQIQWIQVCFLHILFLGWGALILAVTLLPSVRRHYALSQTA